MRPVSFRGVHTAYFKLNPQISAGDVTRYADWIVGSVYQNFPNQHPSNETFPNQAGGSHSDIFTSSCDAIPLYTAYAFDTDSHNLKLTMVTTKANDTKVELSLRAATQHSLIDLYDTDHFRQMWRQKQIHLYKADKEEQVLTDVQAKRYFATELSTIRELETPKIV